MDMILYGALMFYLLTGFATGLAFILFGVMRVQAAPVTAGARILLLPGATALWPLVLFRWLRSVR